MNEKLTQKIQRDFDWIALCEQAWESGQARWDHNNHYHRFLLKHFPYGQTALDIGCGTGEFSRLLAQRFYRVNAIDLSPNMIRVAKQRSQQYSNIEFRVADILKWRFPVEQFDAITSIATVHHLPLEDLLPNLKTALKPGGKLVILDLLQPEHLSDRFSDLIAVPLNWLLQFLKNQHFKLSPDALAAMKEHIRTDNYLTFSQARQIYTAFFPEVELKKHLFWRYSAVWQKPLSTL